MNSSEPRRFAPPHHLFDVSPIHELNQFKSLCPKCLHQTRAGSSQLLGTDLNSAPQSSLGCFLTPGCRAWAHFTQFLFKFFSQFGEARSFPWLLVPAELHYGVNTRRTVLWSLHAITCFHVLLHFLQRLKHRNREDRLNQQEFSLCRIKLRQFLLA